MSRAAKEGHGIVNLDLVRHSHAHPNCPEAIED